MFAKGCSPWGLRECNSVGTDKEEVAWMGKRWIVAVLVGSIVAAGIVTPVWALTDTTDPISVQATIPLRAEITMIRDLGSVGRGAIGTVVFDRFDDQDGQPDGNPLFMYAPYRSEVGLNWHLASIIANGTTMTLTADVTGTVGGKPLSTIMDVFCGGFFEPFDPPNFKGGASTDWELLDSFQRQFSEPITATTPFTYRLRLRGVSAGTFTGGTVVYTLVSNV